MAGLQVNVEDYRAFFEKTKGLDKKIRNGVRKRMRESAKVIAPKVVSEGVEPLPSGGGLAANIIAKSGGPTISQTSTGVRLVLGRKKGPQIGRMNRGQLRHPSFWVWWQRGSGEWVLSDPKIRKSWKWVEQKIPAGTFSKAVDDNSDEIRKRVITEMHTILEELG